MKSRDYNKKIVHSCTVNQPAQLLYEFWRRFANLPRFMKHLASVTETSPTTSHWVAHAPAGQTVEWDATIINEKPGKLIAWQSTEDSGIRNSGSVRFSPASGNRGTEVRVTIEYDPPGGKIGEMVAKLFGEEPEIQVDTDLRRFKALMETGEIPTTEGQPQGGK